MPIKFVTTKLLDFCRTIFYSRRLSRAAYACLLIFAHPTFAPKFKMGCIFPMAISSEFRMWQYKDDDKEDALHLMIISIRVTASNFDFGLFDRLYDHVTSNKIRIPTVSSHMIIIFVEKVRWTKIKRHEILNFFRYLCTHEHNSKRSMDP